MKIPPLLENDISANLLFPRCLETFFGGPSFAESLPCSVHLFQGFLFGYPFISGVLTSLALAFLVPPETNAFLYMWPGYYDEKTFCQTLVVVTVHIGLTLSFSLVVFLLRYNYHRRSYLRLHNPAPSREVNERSLPTPRLPTKSTPLGNSGLSIDALPDVEKFQHFVFQPSSTFPRKANSDKVCVVSQCLTSDQTALERCFGMNTLPFLYIDNFNGKRSGRRNVVGFIFLCIILCITVNLIALISLCPRVVQTNTGWIFEGCVVICVVGWFSVSVATYALLVKPPTELNMTGESQENACGIALSGVNRTLWAIFFLCLCWSSWVAPVGYILLLLLPFLFLYGIVPKFQIGLIWLIEQIQLFVFGGSPATPSSQLLIYFAICVSESVILFSLFAFTSLPCFLIVAVFEAIVLLTAAIPLGEYYYKITGSEKDIGLNNNNLISILTVRVGQAFRITTVPIWGVLAFSITFGLSIEASKVWHYFYSVEEFVNTDNEKSLAVHTTKPTDLGFIVRCSSEQFLAIVVLAEWLLYNGMCQGRSPPSFARRAALFIVPLLKSFLCLHILLFAPHGGILCSRSTPMPWLFYESVAISLSQQQRVLQLVTVIETLSLSMVCRFAFLFPRSAVCLVWLVGIADAVVLSIFPRDVPSIFPFYFAANLPTSVAFRILLSNFVFHRLSELWSLLRFGFHLWWMALRMPKLRHFSLPLISIVNVVCFPAVLATFSIAALLNAPLVCVWTLPIFLVGYPRQLCGFSSPHRHLPQWKSTSSRTSLIRIPPQRRLLAESFHDTSWVCEGQEGMAYAVLFPSLLKALGELWECGALSTHPPRMFLCQSHASLCCSLQVKTYKLRLLGLMN